MKSRYMVRCAVFLILTKMVDEKEYVLLQHRYHTGLLDGLYDVSTSGHLEQGESVKEALIRETMEEIGVLIHPDDLHFVTFAHARFSDAEYLMPVFSCSKWSGEAHICEADKCDDLVWFDIQKLPCDIIDTRKKMIECYLNHEFYFEVGF